MGCPCARRRHAQRPGVSPPRPRPIVVGEMGWMDLRYMGGSKRPRMWRGPFTKQLIYEFGGDVREGIVDARDGVHMITGGPFEGEPLD